MDYMWNVMNQVRQKTSFFAVPDFSNERLPFTHFVQNRGFSFVELIVTVAIFSLVFSGLFAGFQVMTALIGSSKAKAGALSLMSSRMEYIRSLPYNTIGTNGGVPSGTIPQHSTTTLNGITYTERVLIQYIDDPADGVGGADSNAILADYKQAKIEYTWSLRGRTDKAALVSNIVPTGIESTAGGGTIRVNVFDASALPLAGAEVHFVNNTTTTTIDTLRYTDLNGIAYLSGAPAAANYEITATDSGYSTDGTYVATTSNPNPGTPPVAVLESQVSTMNFQIDQLSNLHITTVGPATYGTFDDTFIDMGLVATTSSTTVSSEAVILADNVGVYADMGYVQSTSTTPASLDSWYSFDFTASTTASTSVKVSLLYNNSGTMTLVPDTDLPGNSTGFFSAPIDITHLDTSTYSELALRGTLDTTDTATTPELHQWKLTYITNQPKLSGVDLSIAGAKSIGTDASSNPILKYTSSGTTDVNGQWNKDGIEWDIYTVSVDSPGYSIYEICPQSPYALDPGVTKDMQIILGGASAHLLRVSVSEVNGTSIPDAVVRLQNVGVDELSTTSLCGQTYFNDPSLYDASDYTLTVSAPGFVTQTLASTTVNSGTSTVDVILN
jgi:prepilin-type N-terminal cleavage/methylation domain-containing protein